jgi:hypothetical protein
MSTVSFLWLSEFGKENIDPRDENKNWSCVLLTFFCQTVFGRILNKNIGQSLLKMTFIKSNYYLFIKNAFFIRHMDNPYLNASGLPDFCEKSSTTYLSIFSPSATNIRPHFDTH